jgi:hypothetical protein
LKHLRGEANDIRPGTIGMIEAQIAEKLVAERPELLLPEHKQELLTAIDAIYTRDHCVVVTLTDQEIGAAQLAVTHEGVTMPDELFCYDQGRTSGRWKADQSGNLRGLYVLGP